MAFGTVLKLLGSAALVLPMGFAASTAAAAEAAPTADAAAEADGLTEIVVTAEKRPANLQSTPISISVLGTEDLEARHVQSLGDLIGAGVPSLRLTPYASRPFSLIVNMRGVGVMLDANQPARDPGVGVYVDGVYLGRPQGLSAALYDIASIEVLKGPQGTLFGRNTEGGALNITTKKPSGKYGLEVTAGIGNFGHYEGVVHLDLPEFYNFSVKLDGIITSRDGVVKNPLQGAADFGAYSREGLHGQVQWRPDPSFTANYTYDTSHDDSSTLYTNVVQAGTNKIAPILPIQPGRVRSGSIGIPLQPSVGSESGHALNLKWDVSPSLTIKSISAYRELSQTQWQNTASGAVFAPNAQFARYSLAEFIQQQYSQELQAIGEIGRVKYVVGGLAYHEHVDDMAQTFNSLQFNADGSAATLLPAGSNIKPVAIDIPILFPTAAIDRASRVNSNSYGIYGQGTWTLPMMHDSVHLTGGLRWTRDQKDGDLYVINNAVPIDAFGKSVILHFRKSWSRVDPMVTLALDATQDLHFYGKWSRGYKSGGANTRSLTFKAFDPEEIAMFEIGAKTEFWNHRARFNIAAYTGTYKNVQLDFSGPYYSFDGNGNLITTASTTRTTTDTFNAPGSAKVRGVEADLTLNPVRGLTLNASYAYNYIRIPDTINPFPVFVTGVGTVVSTTPIGIYQAWTPKHAASGAIDYSLPLSGLTVRAHLDGNYDSGSYNTDRDPSPTLKAIRSQPALVFNGRFTLGDIALQSGAKLAVSVWARNLFNEEHLYSRSISTTNGISGNFNDPRTFGIEIKLNSF
jgi:iron complex outermembrane receptor protein